jgi:hypothetical protein
MQAREKINARSRRRAGGDSDHLHECRACSDVVDSRSLLRRVKPPAFTKPRKATLPGTRDWGKAGPAKIEAGFGTFILLLKVNAFSSNNFQ